MAHVDYSPFKGGGLYGVSCLLGEGRNLGFIVPLK